ncbi:MAG: hypothetical protein GXO42_03170 [bacterium]|nr:hypothetical protein [bacterium]
MVPAVLDELERFVQALNREEDSIVLVEGKRDKKALQLLGVLLPVIYLGKFKLELLLEELAESGAMLLLLFDLDEAGESLTRKAVSLCELLGIRYSLKYRQWLRKLRIYRIEELFTVAQLLTDRAQR